MEIPNGYYPASNPPENDRTVLVLFSDGHNELGFFDTVSGKENEGGRWWHHPRFGNPITQGDVVGWKEF